MLGTMKTTQRRRIHAADVPVSPTGPGTPAEAPLQVGPGTFEVRPEPVPTGQGSDPAQAPRLGKCPQDLRVGQPPTRLA